MKTNKFFALALAGVLACASLASCGAPAKTNYAASNTEYFIGTTGPLTGDASSYGTSVNNGAQIAIDELNAKGGLNGVTFKYEMKDDGATSDKAATGYTSLYEAGMQASIGSVTSGSCASFAASAVEDNVFALTPSASADNVIGAGNTIFRVCFGDPQQGTIAADTLTKTYEKIGAIYDSSDPYSSGIYEAFQAQMAVLGKTYTYASFDKDSNKDFSTQVSDLKNAGCEVIFLPIYYTEAGLIAKAAAKVEFNVPLFGCDGLDGIADQLDDSVTAPVSYITPFDVNSTDPTVVAFVTAYKAKYGTAPDQFAADGYDAIMAVYAAMKAAGVNDVTISASDLCDKLVATFTSSTFSYSGVTGKNMTWTAAGSCNKDANIVVLDR